MTPAVGLHAYLGVGAGLLVLGLLITLTRRHFLFTILGAFLILQAAVLNLAAFDRFLAGHRRITPDAWAPAAEGRAFAVLVLAVAAGEVAAGLGLCWRLYQETGSASTDDADRLRE